MFIQKTSITILLALLVAVPVAADELTQIVQQELHAQGYDTGGTDGEMTMKTAIAISKFQAEHGLEVTGEVSPQLAGTIKAAGSRPIKPVSSAATPSAQLSAEDLQSLQQACLQEKVAAAQAAQKKKRGLGRLLSAVSRTAGQFGNHEISQTISEASYDAYNVNATASDLKAAAKDLGLSTDEVEACRNPSVAETVR